MLRPTFRLSYKLAIAVAVPLLALAALALYDLAAQWQIRSQMTQLGRFAHGVGEISRFVHELQRERGASTVFAGSKGAQFRSELQAQRPLSDAQQATAGRFLGELRGMATSPDLDRIIAGAEAAIAGLAKRRSEIDALALGGPDAFAAYTDVIGKLLGIGDELAKLSTRGDVTIAISAYLDLVQSKERAGQERATGAAGLAAGKFERGAFNRLLGLASAQETLLQRFQGAATPAQRQAFRDTMAGPASEQVGRMREVLWAGGTSGELQGLTGKAWFDASSARIDLLKTAEDRIAADLIAATATIVDQADGRLRLLAVIVATVFAACTGVVLLLGRGITRPLAQMRAAMERLAGGDSDFVVPGTGRRDEIGEMAGAVEVFRHNAIERRQLAAEQQQVQERAAEERRADMHRIASQFEAAVGEIVGAVSSSSTELEAAAGTLTDTAERTQRLSSQVASASEEASTNVQSVASATDELSASVHEIGRQVHESSRIARDAVDQARKTDGRIAELAQAAHRIGDVVKLITAVAEQTNLLALNATIEAARAGEAGRGFAVVAQEVKALAGQTAKATDEIGQQIAAMQTATEDSVASIQEIGATIDRVAGIAQSIAAAVEQQGAATREIARNVQQAAHGTSEVAAKITAVDRGASETGSASAQVLSSAQALASEGSKLKLELQQFLATVRAA